MEKASRPYAPGSTQPGVIKQGTEPHQRGAYSPGGGGVTGRVPGPSQRLRPKPHAAAAQDNAVPMLSAPAGAQLLARAVPAQALSRRLLCSGAAGPRKREAPSPAAVTEGRTVSRHKFH
ncbi:hypothetical protein SKAU_G00334270 [Synaphobranchus kaupii]|uniref:Uncharacterized protein n=1 Tax=Synaphobranchus kaupii TaxID=118154 RepID=A0A9Q1ELT3_SYNKA|nr:hypothetical protein SKAU_G00334270 [Synaphobranchus kaupii]